MTNKITLDDIFGEDGAIASLKEGYKPRPAQIEASKQIDNALNKTANALVEGGTGIGKSFAYLFPVLKNIADSNFNKKAIIVTSGISLQEQLVIKDLPFSVDVMKSIYPGWKTDFSFTLLKGRQNFICLKKVDELGLTHLPKAAISENFHEVQDFIKTSFTGDLSDMNTVLNKDVLEVVACCKKAECNGKECNFYSECFYTKHRARVNKSSVIITNYHMLFSDLKVGGTILPSYDILVFDEAHEAANIFRDFDADKLSVNTVLNVRNKLSELNNKTKRFSKKLGPDSVRMYINEFEIAFHELGAMHSDITSPVTIDEEKMLPASMFELGKKLMSLGDTVLDCVGTLSEKLKFMEESDEEFKEISEACRILAVISDYLSSAIDFSNTLKGKIDDENEVVYVEKINDTFYLGNKKIEVGEKLNFSLFARENLSCIFTSATISVAGTFEYLKEQLGLNLNEKECLEYIANSPFDLTSQQLWYLPPNTCNGNEFGFDNYATSNMIEIAEACNGGTLCLFTSIRNMKNARMKFERELGSKYRILSQGDMPKSKLIAEFAKDEDSILLATKSFFTGVDVPGNSLRCVVIDKFPFAQPSDPVQQKLRLKDNAFFKYSIPEMIILLKQAVGRGVRSVDDKCVVCILDGRMSTARYKARIFNSFDYKKTSTRDIEAVRGFFK